MISKPIRVLIVEDSEDDCELVLHRIRKGGYTPVYKRVENETDMCEALESEKWDIIISDFSMPSFSGLGTLELVKKLSSDIPVIIVSGNIGEETAVDTMRAGAADYIMKDNLARLLPAIEREMKESEIRIAHKQAKQIIEQLTYYDTLTGLLNRSEFERRVAQSLESAKILKKNHALCYFDLDQFKIINDTCGHLAGDQLLKQISQLLLENIHERDTLARLGGDEFGLLLENCDPECASNTANRLRQAVRDFHFIWQDRTYEVGVSIGVVNIDDNSENLAKVLSAADVACFTAKDLGRNRIYTYEEGDQEFIKRREEMLWVSRISRALDENRFVLYQQTISSIKNPQTENHCEILVRMVDEDGSLILPGEFLPAAERYNLMPHIDRWVVNKVFSMNTPEYRAAKGRNNKLSKDNFCAINISGASLSDDTFLDFIRNKMVDLNVPTEAFCFEITETAAIENLPRAIRFIKELKTLGYRFSLDDFGSGLSSFSYLKNLPVDFLKIDGAFVKDIVDDPIDHALVEAINRIGQVMNIRTIAEFVESEAILEKLKAIGVDFAQGYAIDRPRPACE